MFKNKNHYFSSLCFLKIPFIWPSLRPNVSRISNFPSSVPLSFHLSFFRHSILLYVPPSLVLSILPSVRSLPFFCPFSILPSFPPPLPPSFCPFLLLLSIPTFFCPSVLRCFSPSLCSYVLPSVLLSVSTSFSSSLRFSVLPAFFCPSVLFTVLLSFPSSFCPSLRPSVSFSVLKSVSPSFCPPSSFPSVITTVEVVEFPEN